ncbi:MAG TPA: phage baseplate assembly protein V [Thermoleophilaceae bacterium]|nr:phage baseplate assembly protein V [Thermoleophilaceae bacterium]
MSGPTDLPAFVAKLGGAELDPEVHADVVRVDVHEEIGRLARATLLVRNWNDDTDEVLHSDGDLFAPGAGVELKLGYGSDLETVFEGVVVELGAVFGPGGQPLLEVHCRDRGVLLAGARRSRLLEDSTDGDHAAAVAGDHGLSADSEPGAEQPFAFQSARSDWDLLRLRAEALGYALYVRGATLHFHPPRASGRPLATLQWGATLLELRVHEELAGQMEGVTATGWDPETLEAAEAAVAAGDSAFPVGARPGLEKAVGAAGFSGRAERLASAAALGLDELDGRARAALERGALEHYWGRGRSQGLPQLRVDGLVELEGLGTRFSGSHYVTAVRHTLDSKGYFTEFQLGRPPALQPPADQQACAGAPLAVGLVDDIDDPNGWGRVKVLLPWLDGEIGSVWARLALPAAGPERGFFFIPEVGDEVVVGFLQGDVRHPVVLGSLWNGVHAPPETLDAQANAIRAIVSRSGHRFTFDDTDGAEKVEVKTSAEQTLTLDDASGSEKIQLKDKAGNEVTMESAGITLKAASGDIKLEASAGKISLAGKQIEGKATGPAKLESSAKLDLQAAATLGLTGALVKINS